MQLRVLSRWATEQEIALSAFGKRHMDRYLVWRAEQGMKPLTLHHDAITAKVFFKWCAANDILERNPLVDFAVRTAPQPPRYMPTQGEVIAYMNAILAYWDVQQNPNVRYYDIQKRIFHRDRNIAAVIGLSIPPAGWESSLIWSWRTTGRRRKRL